MNGTDSEMDGILALTRELCAIPTGVVADGNERMLARLARELPFEVVRYPSGANHNGWIVPQNWHVDRATISRDGVVLFDGTAHLLGVAMYSRSFAGELDWEELKKFLVTNPDQPDAYMFHSIWQIRSWAAEWRLCVPHKIFRTLGPGTYRVDLATCDTPGDMPVAVYEHRGASEKTIVFHTNTCHPTQANDGFCAVATLVRLFQSLKGRKTHYSYRLLLAPEHLGSVMYCRDLGRTGLEKIVSAVFMEMPGNRAPLAVTSTYLGNQPIDRVFAAAARHLKLGVRRAAWRQGCGNDETVWEAPGHEVPCVEVTRAAHFNTPYPEYHSSGDNADLMDPEMVGETLDVLRRAIEILETNARPLRRFDGLICLSSPEYGLYMERHDPTIDKGLTDEDEKWGQLLDSLFRYFDGSTTVLDIAVKHDLPYTQLMRYLRRFEEKGLIALAFDEIERVAITPIPASRGA
jgi:aminopeptidase-like protein